MYGARCDQIQHQDTFHINLYIFNAFHRFLNLKSCAKNKWYGRVPKTTNKSTRSAQDMEDEQVPLSALVW